jgi:phosphoribosylglycinamide formyltransferase-1
VKSIVVLASGSGSNFENLVLAGRDGRLAMRVVALISDRKKAGCIERAERLGVPSYVLVQAQTATGAIEHDQALAERLKSLKPDWILLAGYLRKIGPEVLKSFPDRIINIHPSLLPSYGGKGMYGEKVFAAVLHAGEAQTGVTVHLVNEHFDQGRILEQRTIAIDEGETVATLRSKTQKVEHDLFISVLNKLC